MDIMDLCKALEAEFSNLKWHPSCLEELASLAASGGYARRLYGELFGKLRMLSQLGHEAAKSPPAFKKLTGAPGLCRIALRSKAYNIRIIYAFSKSRGVLLLAFYEKSGKRKTDYSTHIPPALARLQEIEGGTNHET